MIYFTKLTNSPDVSNTAAVLKLFVFEPWLATGLQGQWLPGGDDVYPYAAQRLGLILSGSINSNRTSTAVRVASVSLLESGGLTDDKGTSHPAHSGPIMINGSWGEASQPQFMSEVSWCSRVIAIM